MRDAPSISRAPVIIIEDEPYVRDVCTKATNQTSGSRGSGQQGPVDADVETEYIRGVECEAYYKRADDTFHKIFVNNTFGHVCDVCDRIWFKLDLSLFTVSQAAVLEEEFASERHRLATFKLCSTCRQALNAKKVPSLGRSNGYKYHEHPTHLPPLDPITERPISPRLPFMQIRRLRQETGTYKI
jgi:hypothetical protein